MSINIVHNHIKRLKLKIYHEIHDNRVMNIDRHSIKVNFRENIEKNTKDILKGEFSSFRIALKTIHLDIGYSEMIWTLKPVSLTMLVLISKSFY